MKYDFREIKGNEQRVAVASLPVDEIVIYGVRERNVTKRDGSFTKIYEASTSMGVCNISKSLYDGIQKGSLPDDEKLYFSIGYIGVSGSGENSFGGI